MHPNYKPTSSVGVAKLPSGKPSLRFDMATTMHATQGHFPSKLQFLRNSRIFNLVNKYG